MLWGHSWYVPLANCPAVGVYSSCLKVHLFAPVAVPCCLWQFILACSSSRFSFSSLSSSVLASPVFPLTILPAFIWLWVCDFHGSCPFSSAVVKTVSVPPHLLLHN